MQPVEDETKFISGRLAIFHLYAWQLAHQEQVSRVADHNPHNFMSSYLRACGPVMHL